MGNALNVDVAITGAAYVGASGATPPAPADSVAAWGAGWLDLGYIDATGVTEAFADSSADIIAWQNHLLVRRTFSKSELTYKFSMLETKKTTLELFHKNSVVSPTSPYTLSVKNPGSDIRSFGFDIIDGTKHTRIYVPSGEVTARANIVYKSDGAIMYDVTVTAYPDATGTVATKLSADVQWGQS